MSQNIFLEQKEIEEVSEILSEILANEYFLYLKTLNIHWNVTGKNFFSFHQLLETQYEWLKNVIDDIAERIRTLGVIAPANYKKYQSKSNISEDCSKNDFQHMLEDLCVSHEKIILILRKSIKKLGSTNDFGSEDLLIQVLRGHEKNLWILNSHFESNNK